MKRATLVLAIQALLCGGVGQAKADFIGEVWQNQSAAAADAVLTASTSLGAPDATFTTTAFNYNPTHGNSVYSLGPFLNNPTFTNQSSNFASQASYGSGTDGGFPKIYGPNGTMDNTYFYFTGTIFLSAGNNSFVVGHDDGLQLNITGIGLVVNSPGPTSFTNTPFNVNVPTAGSYNFQLSYGETAGPPAALVWTINGAPPVGVPEPSSLTLAGLGLASLFGYGWRKRRQAA